MAVVDVEFRANANFSGLISQANLANAAISKLQASVTSLNAEQINQAFSQFSKGLTGSGQYIAQTVRVSDATQRFGQDLVNNKLQLKDYAREFKAYVTGRESQIKKLADQQVRLQRSMVVSRGADATGSLVAQVFTPTGLSNDLETSAMRATSRIQVMNEFLHKASTAVVNWGKNTQWAGRQMTVGLTVPLSMLATATGKAFYELDAQLIQMQKVYGTGIKGVGDEAISSIRSQVTELSRELAKAYGIPVAQTAALAAEIAQAGKTGDELLASVEQTTKLATLGEIDRQDAMKATLSIQSTFNQNTQELSDSINFLNSVENATNLSLQDLVTGIPKAGPVVRALGGDIKDLSLMMVAMKEGGIPASEAANAIKSSLASLINPTEKVTDKMKKFGIDLVGIVDRNAGQLMPTLMEFRGEINKLDDLSRQRILEELFGKFQFARVNALFNNLGRAGSQTVQVMELMGLSTAELASIADKELKTMAESASGRFKRLWATVQGDLAVAGQGVLNAGSVILSVISKVINGFEKLPDGLKKFLGGTALLAAVIGPIIMTIGVLGNFFGYIMKGLALMRSFGRGGAGDFQLMTAETVAMNNAGSILENTLFDQAKAADVMRTAIEQLTTSLAEMGGVSSTAGRAISDVMANAQGRAAAAGTAIKADAGHGLPKEVIKGYGLKVPSTKEGKEDSLVSVYQGGLIALDPTANLAMGAQNLGFEGLSGNKPGKEFNISSQQVLEGYSSNRAFVDVFGEKAPGKPRSNAAMAGIAKILADDTITLEARFEQLTEDFKIDNPAKLHADFLRRTTELANENKAHLKRIMSAQGDKLETELENSRKFAEGQFVQGDGEKVSFDKWYEAELKYADDQNLSLEERTKRKRDLSMRLLQYDKRYGQTLQGGSRGLIGDNVSVQGSRALSGVTGLPGAPGATTLEELGVQGGGPQEDDRESIRQLSNKRKEYGDQISQNIATEKKAQGEDEKFFAEKESQRRDEKDLSKVMKERLAHQKGLSLNDRKRIAEIRNDDRLSDTDKKLKIDAIKAKALDEREKARTRRDENSATRKNNTAIDKEVAKRNKAAEKRQAESQKEIDRLKGLGRAIRDEERSRIEGTRRRRGVTPVPPAIPVGRTADDASLVVVGGGSGGGPGDVDPEDELRKKKQLRSQRVAATTSALGMGAMLGSTALPAGGLQNAAMLASSISMFAPSLMQFGVMLKGLPSVIKMTAAVGQLATKFAGLGKAAGFLSRLGPAIMGALLGPVGLVIAAIIAVGAAVVVLQKRTEKAFDETNSWVETSAKGAERMGYKYTELNNSVSKLAGTTKEAKTATDELVESIKNAPSDDPFKKISNDWKNDKDDLDTVTKAVTLFQKQISLGVDAGTAKSQVSALLQDAGKQKLSLQVEAQIDSIDLKDTAGIMDKFLTEAFKSSSGKSSFANNWETWSIGIVSALKPLTGGWADKVLPFDKKQMDEFNQTFFQTIGIQSELSPEKWQAFTEGLSTSQFNTELTTTNGALQQLQNSFINATGAQGAWLNAANNIRSAEDAANLMYLSLNRITPAATQAGWAVQVAFAQAADSALAAEAAAINWSSIMKNPVAGGPGKKTTSGASADPYKAQKDANEKRIDQEKDIIKAIEKKRSAEKKAFDEKKRQNEFLNKQADLQIGYREALASGDFAAAALVKNQMLNEQRQKSLEDAQARKDDQYQRDIDARQSNVDRLEKANQGLDKLSQKAKEVAAASSGAISTVYTENITKAKEQMTVVLDRSKTQNYTNAEDMKRQNNDVAIKVKELGGDVDQFFKTAYKATVDANKGQLVKIEGLNDDLRALVIRQQYNNTQLMALATWMATPEGQGASAKEIEQKILQLRSVGVAAPTTSLGAPAPGQDTGPMTGARARAQWLNSPEGRQVKAQDGYTTKWATFESSGYPKDKDGKTMSRGRWVKTSIKDPENNATLRYWDNGDRGLHSGGAIDSSISDRAGRSKSMPIQSDEVPILAQRGEYMINANAAKKIGVDKLNMMNSGELPKYHTGGLIEGQGAGPNEIAPESSYIKYIYGQKNKPKTAPKTNPKTPTVQQQRSASPAGTGTNDSSNNSTAARYGNIRPVSSAVSYLEGQIKNGTNAWKNLCERLARTAYGLDGHFATAKKHFNAIPASQRKNLSPASAKQGMLGFWDTGSAGHIAVADGGGSFYTNLSNGKVGKLKASTINTWGPKLGVTNPYWGPGKWIDVVSGNRAGFDSKGNPTLSGPQGRRGSVATVHTGGPIEKLQSDEVQRVLQTGEYVINRNAARSIGRANLESLNSGKQLANTSNSNYNIVVNPSIGMNENDLAEKVIGKIKLMDKRKGGVR